MSPGASPSWIGVRRRPTRCELSHAASASVLAVALLGSGRFSTRAFELFRNLLRKARSVSVRIELLGIFRGLGFTGALLALRHAVPPWNDTIALPQSGRYGGATWHRLRERSDAAAAGERRRTGVR